MFHRRKVYWTVHIYRNFVYVKRWNIISLLKGKALYSIITLMSISLFHTWCYIPDFLILKCLVCCTQKLMLEKKLDHYLTGKLTCTNVLRDALLLILLIWWLVKYSPAVDPIWRKVHKKMNTRIVILIGLALEMPGSSYRLNSVNKQVKL